MEPIVRQGAAGHLLVALVVILAVAETVLLGLYVHAVQRAAEAEVRLEYANGAALIAAQRCSATTGERR